MNLVELRFEALQCHLRGSRTDDPSEATRLFQAGERLSMIADELEREANLEPA